MGGPTARAGTHGRCMPVTCGATCAPAGPWNTVGDGEASTGWTLVCTPSCRCRQRRVGQSAGFGEASCPAPIPRQWSARAPDTPGVMFAQMKAHAGANRTLNSTAPTAIQDAALRA